MNTAQAKAPKQVFVERSAKTGLVIGKSCSACGEILPLADFNKNSKTRGGYLAECKSCAKIRKATPPSPEAIALKTLRTQWGAVGHDELKALYAEGMTDVTIGEKFGINKESVKTRRNACGLFEIPHKNLKPNGYMELIE